MCLVGGGWWGASTLNDHFLTVPPSTLSLPPSFLQFPLYQRECVCVKRKVWGPVLNWLPLAGATVRRTARPGAGWLGVPAVHPVRFRTTLRKGLDKKKSCIYLSPFMNDWKFFFGHDCWLLKEHFCSTSSRVTFPIKNTPTWRKLQLSLFNCWNVYFLFAVLHLYPTPHPSSFLPSTLPALLFKKMACLKVGDTETAVTCCEELETEVSFIAPLVCPEEFY